VQDSMHDALTAFTVRYNDVEYWNPPGYATAV
jgi:hypothetical protein